MRLIDADAVFEKFSKEYKETTKLISSGECHLDNLAEGFTECHEIIKSMPTIDAVPVIRCKDCKCSSEERGRHNKKIFVCRGLAGLFRIVEENEFCPCGERREPNDPDEI